MRRNLAMALAAAGVLATSVAAFAGTDLNTSWSNGLSLQSEDKSFKLKIGGRIMDDWAWFSQDDSNEVYYGNIQDGTEFRRARIALSGTVYSYILFKAEFDFAGAAKAGREVAMKDVYMGITGIPVVGTIQMGHQKEPFGLEIMTSSNYHTFMERAVTTAFGAERNHGIRAQNAFVDDRLTVTAGVFRNTDDGGRGTGDGKYAGTARVTVLPWSDDEAGGLLHLGGAYSYRNPDAEIEFASRPSAHLAPDFVGVEGTADAVSFFGGEGAFCYGPFRAQGEYMMAAFDADAAGDPSFMSYYAYASALLTGERYKYKKSEAVFEGVEPKMNFRQDGKGAGAWELGVRYAFLDLNDRDIWGGEMTDITVGLNWYMNPNARIMLNYVNSSVKNIGADGTDAGSVNVFETRFHIFF